MVNLARSTEEQQHCEGGASDAFKEDTVGVESVNHDGVTA